MKHRANKYIGMRILWLAYIFQALTGNFRLAIFAMFHLKWAS